jgi:uncharacterized protein YeaO (DUF488 family)
MHDPRAEVMAMLRVKRVYEAPSERDGTRVLVDGLWPRALAKKRARVDVWLKELAPSAELRRWFGHDPARWREFRARYREELKGRREALQRLRDLVRAGAVTIVFAARDTEHNNAMVIAEYLAQLEKRSAAASARRPRQQA